ncbi:OLC1v1013536C1 [Oldenlandia corymbosa var. corymbosa]|uniref:OLC1v1013536C1 n=1 Tax=Oldenlandia corymbosa var. corymbosa TaxID=529605 RepID=A0AAV1DYS5_OLDCO|nr:OLC1v1013536C1 [Oldenlandia corymbosa var. corymbosa]
MASFGNGVGSPASSSTKASPPAVKLEPIEATPESFQEFGQIIEATPDGSGKAFSFGHPSVQSIIEKYLQNPNNPTDDQRISQNRRNTSLHEMNQLEKQVKEAKKRREALKKAREEDPGKEFWKVPIDELDLEQLSMYAKALQGLKKDVDKEILSHSIKEAGSTSINDMENVLNPVRVRASDELLLAGQVSGGGNSLVVGDEEEGIDLNLTLRPGSGNYLERVGDNRKPIRVYQFI